MTTAIDFRHGLVPKTKDAKTGRDILHRSTDRESLVQQAKDHARQFEDGLKSATRGIAGARFDSVRAAKDPKRLDEKVKDEKQPIHTIPDILAGRISIDSPEAHARTADSIRKHFNVVRDVDQFDKGDPDTGYRVHKMQVKVTPELSAEAHLVPKEVLAANEKQHDVYEDARDAELDGKDGLAAKKTKQAKAINDAAMDAFNARNGSDKGGQNSTSEPKYKFGSTQVNIPEGSDGGNAIDELRGKIPKEHLAGDGADVGGNHVTVRYGLKDGMTPELQKFIEAQKPFEARMGKTDAFPPSEHSDGAAPVHVKIDAPELHRINAEIGKHGDFKENSFPDYKPHASIAYVKPDKAHLYKGNAHAEGKSFPVKSIAVTDRNGNATEIQLKGKGGRGESPEQVGAAVGTAAPALTSNDAPKQEVKAGSNIRLKDGTHAKVAYAPPPKAPIPMYRLRTTNDGKTLHVRARDIDGVTVLPGDWIGVDIDKTLAHFTQFKGATNIGKPIPEMVAKVKQWLKEGEDVRIFTARIAHDPTGVARKAIEQWCEKNIGMKLPITNVKDDKMRLLFDDRARQVEPNTGKVVGDDSTQATGSVREPAAVTPPAGKQGQGKEAATNPTVRPGTGAGQSVGSWQAGLVARA